MRIHPFLLSLLFFVFPSLIVGHTIISRPTPRENTVHTNASPFECGASTAIANTYTRGQVIPFQWGRNNHYGGFVQASVLPMAQARDIYSTATRDAFDNPANIVHVSCYNQPSCQACQGCSDGFYGTGGDGTNFQQNLCNTQMTIPNYLPDGDYVMKIVVFGNGDSFGVRNMPHSSYSNCHNFRVAGGGAVQAKAAGNRHIEWGAGNAGLSDHGITLINRNKGLNLAQGRCGFMGTNTHMGCVPVNGVRSPTCTGPVATLTKCGNAGVDNRQQCLGANNEDQAQRGDLYNYILGLPAYHPDYRGDFTLLSYATQTVRQISLNAGGNNTGGGAATGTCEANGNCRANPGCCGAGKLCYEKDQFYAGCYDINTCTPGIHQGDPAEYRTPWSCLVLGTQANTAGAFGIYWKSRLDRVVDVAGATNTNGNQVWMYENYGPGPAQRFEWVNGEQIRWQGTDKCLDVPGGNNQNGVGLIIWQCDPANPNQKFARNGERIEWKGSGRCLDVNAGGTTLGTKLQIWDCDENNPNQQFVLQPLVRSGSAFVNTKALDSAMSLMTAVKKELIWMQGRPVIDSDSNIETSFLVVPVGSEIDFHGASSTNIVKQVCLELFEKGGKTNPCSPQDDPVVTLKEENGKVFFWTTTPGDYYFMGTTVKDPTSLSVNQRVRISFVQALSSAEVANAINEADLDGDGELDPTTRPPRPTYARSSASSLQTGFMAIISVGVAFFFMKF